MKSLRILLLGGALVPALALAQTNNSQSSAADQNPAGTQNSAATQNQQAQAAAATDPDAAALSGATTGGTDTSRGLQAFGGNGMMSPPAVNNPRAQAMMQQWGMTPSMLQQARLMMNVTVSRDDPAAILGLKEDLKLEPAQVAQLKKIVEKAEVDARAVLSQKQETALEKYPVEPTSMAQMHQRMMATIKQRQQQAGAPTGNVPSPCAMMDVLAGQQAGSRR